MKINMPTDVSRILDVLHDHGYEAYAVGGCIRDSILGRKPDDWDITTSATPYQVKELFPRTVDTGLIHGTVTVMIGKCGYEVTTYRVDGEYEDGRHPKEVSFTSSLTEDLKRRDFTINAMAYSEETGLVDQFGGIDDLKNRIIRCVGDPLQRFGEDALRMLRAVRFAAQLGFSIEENTRQGIVELVSNLSKISSERIQVETVKLLVSDRPDLWKLAYETGITGVVMPEFDRMMEEPCKKSWGNRSIFSLGQVKNEKVLRLTMLFHYMGMEESQDQELDETGAEISRKILRRLKFDNDTIRQVTKLVLWHRCSLEPDAPALRRKIYQVGEDLFPLLLQVQRGDILSGEKEQQKEKLAKLEQVKNIYQKILEDKDCVSLKTLAVTGRDLIESGCCPGPSMGQILNDLLHVVLENPKMNEKEILLSMVDQEICQK